MVATNESAVRTESLLDAIVIEDGQDDGCLSDPTGTNESDGCEAFGQAKDLADQLGASEADPWCRRRRFPECARCK